MPPQAPPSIKELLTRAVADSKRLANAQLALTKVEISASGERLGTGAALGIATLGILFFFVMFLLLTIALVIVQLGLQPWAGFLIVTGALLICAVVTALVARKSFTAVKPPMLAIEEFEKTKAALNEALAPQSELDAELPRLAGQ